jgi:hypothetical protein
MSSQQSKISSLTPPFGPLFHFKHCARVDVEEKISNIIYPPTQQRYFSVSFNIIIEVSIFWEM